MTSLIGKWSLVTGASRGVGSHIAEGLAQQGSNVVLHSRELTHTRALAAKLGGLGVKVIAVSGELSDQAQVDAMLDAAIEAGADDVASSENGHEIYASQETFREVAKALEAKFGEARKAALTWKPQNTLPVDDETGEKLLKLIDLLNEHDDVQNVYANFEVSDALVTKMGG